MPLKTPSFWYRTASCAPHWLETVLLPLSWVYGVSHRLNQRRKTPRKASIPVLCIGNAVAGGSGKTPTATALSQLLKTHGVFSAPAFLLRGYGGSLSGPVRVAPSHSVAEAGDEGLLLAKAGPTIISRDRYAGAELATQQEMDAVLMDDGLQNNSLHKDLSFMVIDGGGGFGNGRTLPAGPLREGLDSAFEKTDAFIMIGKDLRDTALSLPQDKPLFTAHVQANVPTGLDLSAPVVAFAGLGRPEKFYHLLQHLGVNIVGWHAFPDHHVFRETELDALEREARDKGATLLTTDKDFIRLAGFQPECPFFTLPIEIVFDDAQALVDFIRSGLKLAA